MTQGIDEYLKLKYTVMVRQCADGSFFAEIAEFPGCWAEGRTEDEARSILEEAKRLWIEEQLEDQNPIPESRVPAGEIQMNASSLFMANATSIVNETSQRIFSDSAWTHNLAQTAIDYIESPQIQVGRVATVV